MNSAELEKRTKAFAMSVIRYVSRAPRSYVSVILTRHKIGIVEKEAAETRYWLELCEEAMIGNIQERRFLYRESTELLAIFTRTGRTLKERSNSKFAIRSSQFPS